MNQSQEFAEPYAYARLKIYDPDRGYVLQGIVIRGWHFKGGDGVSQIPDWHPVNRKQAMVLADHHQTDNPSSPLAFDIVDPRVKIEIERLEELERRFRLGLIPRPLVSNAPQALVKGRLGSPQAPTRLEDLEDDENPKPILPSEFPPPTVMGEIPTSSSYSHPEFSSIAPREMFGQKTKSAQGTSSSSPDVNLATLPPSARAHIESLQQQITQLSQQIATIYNPRSAQLYADPAQEDLDDAAAAAGKMPEPGLSRDSAPTSPIKRRRGSKAVAQNGQLPPAMQGRMQALQGLQDTQEIPEAPEAPVAPETREIPAPADSLPAENASPFPPSVQVLKQDAEAPAKAPAPTPARAITPIQKDDPALLPDTEDPEEAAVFHHRQDLTQELDSDDMLSDAELRALGAKIRSPNDDKSDPDLDAVVAAAEEEKQRKAAEAEAKAKVKK